MGKAVSGAQGYRVLIVDDDPVMLATTQALLEAAGYEVATHQGAFGATAAIMDHHPDLVLLDMDMPGLSGGGLASLVRGRAQFDDVRIFFFSSGEEQGLKAVVAETGADGYILKGDRAELQRRVAAILGG